MATLKGKEMSFFQDNFDLCVSENKRKNINGKRKRLKRKRKRR